MKNGVNVSVELLEFLIEKGIVEKFFREVINYKEKRPNYREPIDGIASGFNWMNSIYGYEFWLEMDLEFRG